MLKQVPISQIKAKLIASVGRKISKTDDVFDKLYVFARDFAYKIITQTNNKISSLVPKK